jgi:hypothetical protein
MRTNVASDGHHKAAKPVAHKAAEGGPKRPVAETSHRREGQAPARPSTEAALHNHPHGRRSELTLHDLQATGKPVGTSRLHHAGNAETTPLSDEVLNGGEVVLKATTVGKLVTRGEDVADGKHKSFGERAAAAYEAAKSGAELAEAGMKGYEAAGGFAKGTGRAARHVAASEFENMVAKKLRAGKRLLTNPRAVGTDIKRHFAGGHKGRILNNHEVASAVTRHVDRLLDVGAKGLRRTGLRVGERVGARGAAVIAGKAAGRFVPFANAAIAAADSIHAYQVWRNPKASGWKKGMATATAALSFVAAFNVPVVSQVAAGLSLATSVGESVVK